MGIRILNYFDDWLILAKSQAVLTSHKTLLLSHLDCQGLRVNFSKSIRSPSQRVSFLVTVIDSATATVSAGRAMTIQCHAASFKEGTTHPLKALQRMLGLMAAASPVFQLGLLHMQPIQFWLKQGVILDTAYRRKVVTTDASNKSWGALCEGKQTFGLRSEEESGLHINCLEMLTVGQACQFFLPDIRGHHVLIHSADPWCHT